MNNYHLTRSLTANGCRREKISPFLFGQRGILNHYFLPVERDLPSKGLVFKAYTFDFGFNNAATVLGPYSQNDFSLAIRKNFVCWAINAHRQVLATNGVLPAENVPPLLFNVMQQHNGTVMQWFNKSVAHLEAGGLGKKPGVLKEPTLVLAGDTLDVDVQNLGNYNLAAQIVLYGGEFE